MTGAMTSDVVPGPLAKSSDWRHPDRHYQAVLCAEARRLASELRFSRPMRHGTLAQRCRTDRWREGSLDAAVRQGIRERTLRRLAFGFTDVERPHPETRQPTRKARPTPAEVPVRAGVPPPGRTRPHSTDTTRRSGRPAGSRSLEISDGTRETEPLILILLGVAIPIALVALAAASERIALLVLAITAMLAGTAGIGVFVRRLTKNPQAADDTRQSDTDDL